MNTSEKIMTVIMVLLLPILAFAVMKHNKAAQPLPQIEMPRVEKPCPDENACPPPSDEVGKDNVGNPGDVPGYQPPPERRIFNGRIRQRFGY
jgi:hypothetical protein